MVAYKYNNFPLLFLCLVLARNQVPVNARNWRDIQTAHAIRPDDWINKVNRFEHHVNYNAPAEDTDHNGSPTPSPVTDSPPIYANDNPDRPDPPAFAPTAPETEAPVQPEYYPENPIPLYPPRGYFNYDLREANAYGPGTPDFFSDSGGHFSVQYRNNGWSEVRRPANDYYWDEFGPNGWGPWTNVLTDRNMNENQCGNSDGQSPIDIRLSGVACVEHHQIRTRPGDFRVTGAGVQKRIESNKLRLVYQRRPCRDVTDSVCSEPDPPAADFPNGWGGFADLMHVDFKVPSEHRIYGEKFDAEMQIYQLHPGRERLPAISVLMKVDPAGFNSYLQTAIDAFQFEYDLHRSQCADNTRKVRRLVSDFQSAIMNAATPGQQDPTPLSSLLDHHKHWADYSTDIDNPQFLQDGEEHRRKMQSGRWHPYSEELIPTYWFYGYDGSLTEPPCSEIVSWFVMDEPMIISPEQLEQMKGILFTHVDPDTCQPTSTHFQESVARPIQESAGRQVWRCTKDDYLPDAQRSNN